MHVFNRLHTAPLLVMLSLFAAPVALFAQAGDAPARMASPGVTPTVFDAPDVVKRYQATITPEDLAAHLYLFASDLFEGRETTTRGQKLAARYLAAQYRKMGLEPRGTVETDDPMAPEAYFQPFTVYGRRLSEARLTVSAGGAPVATSVFSPTEHDDQAFFAFGTVPEVSAGVVFGGYGIADDDLGFNEYAALEARGIDYSDKWLLILRDEPLQDAETSLLPTPDHAPSQWTTSRNIKFTHLMQGGLPRGILLVNDIGPRAEKSMAEMAAEAAARQGGVGNLSLQPQGGGFQFPPIYVISSTLADKILAPTGRTLAEVKAEIDANLKPVVFEVEGATVESKLSYETYEATTENVIAFVEGSDPALKDEVVVVSSHYDHIGMTQGEGDTINNGADDDGSGTVSVLEIAEAFARAKADGYGPRRSILFLNVTGEEKGLLGSQYFTDEAPVVPLENIVTDLNIDMIGRHDPTYPGDDPNYVYIIGSNLISQELHDINQRVNTLTDTNVELNERFNTKDDPNQFYRRSDHWNFGKHSIPFIFFFTGTHEDYHGVGDEPDKIDYPRMANIARLIFATAWQVANQDAPPAVSGQGFN